MTLELHAKTYYSTEEIQGGDQHMFSITPEWRDDKLLLYLQYGSTGWHLREHDLKQEPATLGAYVTLRAYLHGHWHSALEGAELLMVTKFSYWGSFPSGYKSVDWNAQLRNTHVEITKVTN